MHILKFSVSRTKLKLSLLFLLIASCAGAALLALPGISSSILPAVIPIILFQPPRIQVPTAVLPFNSNLQSAAITPDGSKLYASDSFNNTVSVIDLSINKVIAILDAGNGPTDIEITPDGSKAYVANSGSDSKPGNTVSVIDTSTNKVVTVNLGLVNVELRPSGLAITPDGSKVLVTASTLDLGNVLVINVSDNQVLTPPIEVGFKPSAISIAPDGSRAYVANTGSDTIPGNTVSVIDIPTNQVIFTINVGLVPTNIAITPDGSKVYVANTGSDTIPGNTVSVIDVEKLVLDPKNAVIAVVVGIKPGVIAISSDGSRVYVANLNSDTVSVIETATNAVIATVIDVGPVPIGIAITGDNSKIYVANFGTPSAPGKTVSVIDAATNEEIDEVDVEPNPIAVLIAPDNSRVYVANADTITVIDVPRDIVINKIFVRGGGPTNIAIAPDGSKVYLASSGRDRVSVIDVSVDRIIATINVGSKPSSMAITPDGSNLYVTNFSDDTVSVISTSTNTVIDIVDLECMNDTGAVPCSPLSIAMTPNGAKAYVANFSGNTVSVIDVSTNSVITNITDVGPEPSFIATTPDGTRAYVTNVGNDNQTGGSTISVIDTSTDTVITTVPVGLRPVDIAITPDSTKAFVSNFLSNTVSVIDVATNSVIPPDIAVGPGPSFITITPTPDVSKAYVVNPADQSSFGVTGNTVSVIDIKSNTLIIPPVQVGSRPIDLAIRPDGAQVFVVNYFSNTVSVIDTLTNQVITTLKVGNAPLAIAIAITPDGAKAYVANTVSETVSVINVLTDEVIKTIMVSPRPSV